MGRIKDCDAGGPGRPGTDGKPATEPDSAVRGTAGNVDIKPLTETEQIPRADWSWLSKYTLSAEDDHLNGRIDECLAKLTWLQLIVLPHLSDVSGMERRVDNKANAIRANIIAGLDPFGRSQSFVNLMTVDQLERHVERVMASARVVEDTLESLKARSVEQNSKVSAARAALAAVRQHSTDTRSAIHADFQQVKELKRQIESLHMELRTLWVQLQDASVEFKDALAASAGCSFNDVLTFASLVATVYATGGAAVAAFSSSATALIKLREYSRTGDEDETWFQGMEADAKQITAIVRPAGDAIGDLRSSYAEAKTLFAQMDKDRVTAPGAEPPSDEVKLLANKSSFDEAIAPYIGLGAAREYKRLMDLFVSMSEARNNLIVEHDGIVRRIWDRWTSIRIATAEWAERSAGLDLDFDMDDHVTFLEKALQQIKVDSIRSLTDLARSINYMTGEAVSVPYDRSSIATIASSFARISAAYQQSLSQLANAAVDSLAEIRTPLKDVLTPSAKAAFLAGDPVFFTLDCGEGDLFAGTFAVMARQISIHPQGEAGAPFRITFQHQGRSIMRTRTGGVRAFTHNPVRAFQQHNAEGAPIYAGNLGADFSTFMGVSPYGPWKMTVVADAATRRRLFEGNLSFKVRSRPLPI